MQAPMSDLAPRQCPICLCAEAPVETQRVRCNVRRFRDRYFEVWRCAQCRSIHCEKVQDLAEYYAGYPIRNQELNYFLRAWYRIVLNRLKMAGLKQSDSILDYGCNQGLFLKFLRENGFHNCAGYDPYVEEFSAKEVLAAKYDFVVSLDVIEHDLAPHKFIDQLAKLLKPNGHLCLETPNAAGIDLADTDEYLHALHVPYHVHILSEQALVDACVRQGLEPVATYNRWYMDAWIPGTARRLFESLMKFGDNDIDSGYEPPRIGLFFKHPSLLFHLFFGYLFPAHKTDHVMVVLSRRE